MKILKQILYACVIFLFSNCIKTQVQPAQQSNLSAILPKYGKDSIFNGVATGKIIDSHLILECKTKSPDGAYILTRQITLKIKLEGAPFAQIKTYKLYNDSANYGIATYYSGTSEGDAATQYNYCTGLMPYNVAFTSNKYIMDGRVVINSINGRKISGVFDFYAYNDDLHMDMFTYIMVLFMIFQLINYISKVGYCIVSTIECFI